MSKLNLTPCCIRIIKKNLTAYYTKAIEKKMDLKKLDSVFLWSSPGIGKSQMVHQIAEELEKNTGIPTEVREIRLGECSLFELLGLMHRDPKTDEIVYDAPPIYKDTDSLVVCFLDELDKAGKQLRDAALHLVLEKRFWQYELPKNTIVIAAGNPENIEKELFSKFAPELNNRFRHYLLEPDYPSWADWAVTSAVHPYVIGFLEANQHLLYAEDAGLEHAVFYTPRTWMKVSDYLNLMFDDGKIDWDMAYLDICGHIGKALAGQFMSFCTTRGMMPRIEDIVRGRVIQIPKRSDIRTAVTRSLAAYLYSHRGKLTAAEWGFAREYIDSLPDEYGVIFYRNIAALKLQNEMLGFMTVQERNRFKLRFGKSLTGGLVS